MLSGAVQAEAQRLPRMSAAYGFIAAPPGSALHAPSQPLRPVPNMNKRRGTLKPAVAGTTLPQVYTYPHIIVVALLDDGVALYGGRGLLACICRTQSRA